jgi:hypothetical protein
MIGPKTKKGKERKEGTYNPTFAMWFLAELTSSAPSEPVDAFPLLSPSPWVNVLGRITKPKRSIQVKNLARRVWTIKSLLLRARSSASGTLGPGSAGTPAVAVGIVESCAFSSSGLVGAGVESAGGSGGFSLETGAAWDFVSGAPEGSTLALKSSLTGCFSFSAEKQGLSSCQLGKSDFQKRKRV